MKYVSLDFETLGLFNDDPKQRSPEKIVGGSFVVEDTDSRGTPVAYLPHFTFLVDQGIFSGEAYALQMNAWLLKLIATNDSSKYPIYKGRSWIPDCQDFLDRHFGVGAKRIFLSGKNVGSYDMDFLPAEIHCRFDGRTIDPGSIYMDWVKGPQALGSIKRNLGMSGYVSHDMHEDACDVIAVNRQNYPPLKAE